MLQRALDLRIQKTVEKQRGHTLSKLKFGSAAILALALGSVALPAHAQEGKETQAEKKEETPEERTKRKKAVLEKERENVREILPHDGSIDPKEEDALPRPDLDFGPEGANVTIPPFRRGASKLIADLIAPYDKCQENPTSEEVNEDYEEAYKALQEKIDYLEKQLSPELRKQLRDSEIKDLQAELDRLTEFRNAMPKPGQCYGYHGK